MGVAGSDMMVVNIGLVERAGMAWNPRFADNVRQEAS